MLSIYNSQYADYMTTVGYTLTADGDWIQTSEPELTEAKKEILREKKKILTKVDPLIKAYTGYVESGVIPTQGLETTIIQNLELLLGMV